MKLLIDADVLAYRAGFATEKTKYLVEAKPQVQILDVAINKGYFDDAKEAKRLAAEIGPSSVLWSRKELEPEDKALMIVDVTLGEIRARYSAENPSLSLYLSGVGNFRHAIASRTSYKGNRSGTLPPTHLKAIRNHLVAKWGAVLSAGEEADDLIGIAMTDYPDSVCVSIDKDLLQLPGRHFNPVTKEEVIIGPKEAALNFYAQVLSGDPVDAVPGVTGIGPVKARKHLEDCKSPSACWRRILDVYSKEFNGKGAEYALEAARLVYVRRKVGEIWTPPA